MSDEFKPLLVALITNQDILAALNGITEDKIPGIDGFTTKFVIFFWDIIGNNFWHMPTIYLLNKNFPIYLNTHS